MGEETPIPSAADPPSAADRLITPNTKEKPSMSKTEVLDLDAMEESESRLAPPYQFNAGGQTFTATNPQLLDWRTYTDLDPSDTPQVLEAMLGAEQFKAFRELGLPKWKLDKLAKALGEHFDPDRPAEKQ